MSQNHSTDVRPLEKVEWGCCGLGDGEEEVIGVFVVVVTGG